MIPFIIAAASFPFLPLAFFFAMLQATSSNFT
jgi:hypothetical protein